MLSLKDADDVLNLVAPHTSVKEPSEPLFVKLEGGFV